MIVFFTALKERSKKLRSILSGWRASLETLFGQDVVRGTFLPRYTGNLQRFLSSDSYSLRVGRCRSRATSSDFADSEGRAAVIGR
jgi:hypothetical protein